MKILLIGSSSDIARNLVENANYEFEFIELTSTPTSANQHQIDVQNEESYPQIDVEINGIVYFPGSINLRPFSSLKLSDFQKRIMKLMYWFDKNIETLSQTIGYGFIYCSYQFCCSLCWHALSCFYFDVQVGN